MKATSLTRFLPFALIALPLALPAACSSSSFGTPGNGAQDSGVPTTPTEGGTTQDTSTPAVDSGATPTDSSTAPTDSSTTPSDSSTMPVTDSATPPEDSGIVDTGTISLDGPTGNYAGNYACMLTGNANTTIGPQTLPFNGEMMVTQAGMTLVALLTADGGTSCTVDLTATSMTMASIDANQKCTVAVTMPIMTTATLTFVAAAGDDAGPPGTATYSSGVITANFPFHVSAAGGLVTGTGTLSGPCTKM